MVVHKIYALTSPSNRTYVGYTRSPVKERWRRHVNRALKGKKHPLCNAIRKYGAGSFDVRELASFSNREEALHAEKFWIASLTNAYNLSPGGDDDGIYGHKKLAELRKDKVWNAAYRRKLSEGCKKSLLHRAHWILAGGRFKKWRSENPKEAWKIQNRATRVAARKNKGGHTKPFVATAERRLQMSISQKRRWKNKSPSQKIRWKILRKKGAVRQWERRSSQQKENLACKISASLKKYYKERSPDETKTHEVQLALARTKINHVKRKANQRIALQAYWTPERRKAFGEKRRGMSRVKS